MNQSGVLSFNCITCQLNINPLLDNKPDIRHLNFIILHIPTFRLYLYLLLAGLTAHGQESIGRYSGLHAVHFDPKTRIHTQIFQDSIGLINVSDSTKWGNKVIGIGKMTESYDLHRIEKELYLVNRFGGLVYRVSGDSLQRIDRSFQHLMQNFSLTFVHDGKLFRHGGYGFWSGRREMTFFNPLTREWEVVGPLKTNNAPAGLYNHTGILDSSRLMIMAGWYLEISDPFKPLPNLEVWTFEFKSKEWTRVGQISANASHLLNEGNPGVEADNELVLIHKNIQVFDFAHNEIITYPAAPIQYLLSDERDIRPFYDNGYFFFYRVETSRFNPNKSPQSLELIRIKKKDFLGQELHREPLITSPERNYVWWFLPLLVSAPFAYYWIRNRKSAKPNHLLLTESGLIYQSKSMDLSQTELAVIRLLLSSETEVTTNQILEITQNPNQDYTHNLRMKNQMIEKLNVGLRTLLNISEDVIISERSSVDRRIRTYAIRKEYFSPRC